MQVLCPACRTPANVPEGPSATRVTCRFCGSAVDAPRRRSERPVGAPTAKRVVLTRVCRGCGEPYPAELDRCERCGTHAPHVLNARGARDRATSPWLSGLGGLGLVGSALGVAVGAGWLVLAWQNGVFPPLAAAVMVASAISGAGTLAARRRRRPYLARKAARG